MQVTLHWIYDTYSIYFDILLIYLYHIEELFIDEFPFLIVG